MANKNKALFWVDLEMTGLDEMKDSILEVAIVITDLEFNTLDTYHRVVFQPPEVVAGMNDWCKKTHGDSGLTAAIPNGTPLAEVEKDILTLLNKHYGDPAKGKAERVVLVGNSVGNDKRFIDRYMPEMAKRLHYRIIDISSFKEIFRDKYGLMFQKKENHRAQDDIFESIGELKYYLSFIHIGEDGKPVGGTTA